MCGIFGVIGELASSSLYVDKAKSQLSHRGPDTQQIVWYPGICFGHTLLSIIGDNQILQPILSEDTKGILVFNGEIYNYLEILKKFSVLEKKCSKRPRSDSVVLVEGLREFGEGFLNELNGMFAFAYYDKETNSTLLVRDRLGIKPFFYSIRGKSIIFASESRAVRTLADTPLDPDPEGFYSYVKYRYPLSSRTFDKNINQLRPGSLIKIHNDGAIENKRWWQNKVVKNFNGSLEEAKNSIEELLKSSVELRMRSDHDFTSFLSGGLDSSLITALAKINKNKLDTYSIGINNYDELDESRYSKQIADVLFTNHNPCEIGKKIYKLQHKELIRHLEEPIGVPNQVALKVLSAEISKKHRVVLSGEGADEIFGGYGKIFLVSHDWNLMKKNLSKLRLLFEDTGERKPESLIDFFILKYNYITHNQAINVLQRLFSQKEIEYSRDNVEQDIKESFNSIDCDSIQNKVLILFQNIHLPGLLYRLDTVTMAHSVEARVPFLDYRLVEFLNSIPFEYKIKPIATKLVTEQLYSDEISEIHDIPKFILKKIGEDYLPHNIVYRKKMGFPIPKNFYAQSSSGSFNYYPWVDANIEILREFI